MARQLRQSFAVDDQVADLVFGYREEHALGRPPHLDVEVQFHGYLSVVDLIGHRATLEVVFEGEPGRRFTGIVEEAAVVGSTALGPDAHRYKLRIMSTLGLLGRSVDSRIFQELDVVGIVSQVLQEHGVVFRWRLSGSYPQRTYCVQYQESALDFVQRLLEEEGIFFFVEPGDDEDTVVLCDDSCSADAIEGGASLPLRANGWMDENEDFVGALAEQCRMRSGKVSLRDFNFENPALDLTCEAEADEGRELALYDYPGRYGKPSEGKRLAQVRLEAEQALGKTFELEAVCPRLAAGRKVSLRDAEERDGDYFIVALSHQYADGSSADGSSTDGSVRADDSDGTPDLVTVATVVAAELVYRVPQTTARPLIEGPQTARVVGPSGAESETICTDEHGRCKVKFHWDRAEVEDDGASCWMRVAQPQTSGSMILPRLDWEVVVEFLEGDPDRPVITGRLYNGAFKPPYALPEGKTRTALKTSSTPGGGGSNEIRFEDKAGGEEIMLHAQHDMTLATAENKTESVGNNATSVVSANASLTVGGDQSIKITKGSQSTVGGSQSVDVGGNRNVEVNAVTGLVVGGSATTSVGGNQFEMDGNPLAAVLALAAEKAQAFLQEKADAAVAQVEAHVQGAVDQALGPINDLTARAQSLGDNMQAVADGDMGAIGGMLGDASNIPGAGDFAREMGGEGGGNAPEGGPLSDIVGGGNAITSMANNAVQGGSAQLSRLATAGVTGGVNAAHNAVASAFGVDGAGGGGVSMANAAGPDGKVAGLDETDRTKGPGHAMGKIGGSHDLTVAGIKANAALTSINANVGGSMTRTVGAAEVEVVIGNRAESVEGSKTETALGLVVISKGGESEKVAGAKTSMIGGALVDKLKGSHQVEAAASATFIGAFHKMDAKEKITLKCGGSEVVIDSSGVAITGALVAITAGKIQLPKKVDEA